MSSIRILLTGGAGFIGSAFAKLVIGTTKHDILVVDKLSYAGTSSSLKSLEGHPTFKFVKQDICDKDAMRRLFNEYSPHVILHLAAETHVDRSINEPAEFIQTNIVGTFSLLEAALSYWRQRPSTNFRFHHVSTDEVYGSLDGAGLFTEGSRYNPRSPYSASKASADHLVRAWHHTYGLPMVISVSCNNYGPYQFPEKLIPFMIAKALALEPMPVYGNGQHVRDWIHVDDHARALLCIAQNGKIGETYNVGASCEMSNIDVVRALCVILDVLAPQHGKESYSKLITSVDDRPGHDGRYAVDGSKVQAELGWRPTKSFASGLRETVVWYLANKDWWRPLQRATRG